MSLILSAFLAKTLGFNVVLLKHKMLKSVNVTISSKHFKHAITVKITRGKEAPNKTTLRFHFR